MSIRVAALACVLCVGAAAYGEQAPAKDSATLKELFKRATTHFNLGKFKEAAGEYEELYEAHPDPVLLYNIAQAHRLDGNTARALFFYKRYLINNASAQNRTEVENRISELEHLLAEEHKTQSRPPNEPAPLAHRPVGSEPEAATTATTGSEPPSGATTPTTSEANAASTQPSDRAATPVYKKWWLWTIVGVVVVGAAVGIGVGVAESGGSSFHPNFPATGPAALTTGLGVRF